MLCPLFEVLPSLVSHRKVCPPSRGLVSHCPPLFPLMCAALAFPRSYLPLPPLVANRLPMSPLVPHCFPLCVLRSPSRGLISPCLRLWPIVSPMCACVGRCAHLPEVLSPLICHCFPTRVPVLDGVSAFARSCLLLSPIISPFIWACIWMVCPPSRGLLVSQCLPISEPVLEGASAIPRSCLLLSPIASPHVSLCWMVASHSLRAGVPVLDGVSVFPRFVSPCLQLFRYMCAGCWMMCPRGLVSSCLRLCSIVSHMCACVRCCVGFPEVLSPIVSLSSHICVPVLDGVSACLPLFPLVSPRPPVAHVSLRWKGCSPSQARCRLPIVSPYMCACVGWCDCLRKVWSPLISHRFPMPPFAFIVPHCSHCLPTYVPVNGGLAFLRCTCVGWCVHIPELFSRLVSQLVSHVSPHVCLSRMMRPPFRGLVPPCLPVLDGVSVFPRSCLPLCPFLFPYLGWCVRVSEALSPFLFSFVGWCVCLPEVLSPLSPACPPLFPIVFPHVCPICVPVLCDRLPEVLPPLVSFFLPTYVPVLDGASAFPRSCLRLSPIVSAFVCPCLNGMTQCLPLSSLYIYIIYIYNIYIYIYIYVLAFDFRGLASACLPLSAHNCACPGWCCRFPEVLSRMVFLLVSLCWMVCPLSRLVSPCFLCLPLSHCFRLSVIVL